MSPFLKAGIYCAAVASAAWVVVRAPLWLGSRRSSGRRSADFVSREITLLAGAGYAAGLFGIVLLPHAITRVPNSEPRLILMPVIHTIQRITYAATVHRIALDSELWNTLGNVGAFIPAGILLPLCFPRLRSLRSTFLATLCISMSIEILQLISFLFGVFRSADVDDVILNVTGALIGYGLYRLMFTSRSAPDSASMR